MVRWLPLESNPDVMNKFLAGLGVPSSVKVCDVYGLEPELLAMVPTPVHSLMLLYPLTDNSEAHAAQERTKQEGQAVPQDVYYLKQYVGNACGTIALMHAVLNSSIELTEGALKEFKDSTKDMSLEDRSKFLETFEAISNAHEECAGEGQTEAPDRDKKLDTHFMALVNVGDKLYELDGRKGGPICHGDTSADSFLTDGAKVLKGFMERDSEESRFAVLALTDSAE